MKVAHQGDNKIEIEHLPTQWVIGLGGVCVVLVFGLVRALFEGAMDGALIALAMLAALSWFVLTRILRQFRLVLDRDAGQVHVSATTVFGESETRYPLADLQRVEVDTRYDEGNSTAEPTLALVLSDAGKSHRVRLDPFRPRPEDLLFVAQRINAWLESEVVAPQPANEAEEVR